MIPRVNFQSRVAQVMVVPERWHCQFGGACVCDNGEILSINLLIVGWHTHLSRQPV
jgi:hypothetical protein